jgi:hypothetical protein
MEKFLVVTGISTEKWDEQVLRIGETVSHEKLVAARHRVSSTQTVQGPVLLAVGDVPNGPPTLSVPTGDQEFQIPVVQKTPSQIVPFGDAVTIARVVGTLESKGKNVIIGEKEPVLLRSA